jgi:hypothetical protein
LNRDKHRFVIGQGGKTINQIRTDAQVRITVPKPEENDDAIVLEGTMDNIDKAIKMIQAATSGPAGKKSGSAPRSNPSGGASAGAPAKRPSTSVSVGKTPLPQTAAAVRWFRELFYLFPRLNDHFHFVRNAVHPTLELDRSVHRSQPLRTMFFLSSLHQRRLANKKFCLSK